LIRITERISLSFIENKNNTQKDIKDRIDQLWKQYQKQQDEQKKAAQSNNKKTGG
jgi:hypothetical protein